MGLRANSFAFCGVAYGDEGKGRIVDEFVHKYAKRGRVIVYRDNGGANAGHTVEFGDGQRVALHQLPSGVFSAKAQVILGKGMVLHPGDLLTELAQVKKVAGKIPAEVLIDEMAVLSLDTHRAFENVLKKWQEGSRGSTGRGISPAYADVLLRHPLRARDLRKFNREKCKEHYQLYQALVKGLGGELAETEVVTLEHGTTNTVGSLATFLNRLEKQAEQLKSHIADVSSLLCEHWSDSKTSFIFEKAQAVGLDSRWGVYPDVTASDTTIDGVFASTEGIIDPQEIKIRAGVIKATYTSSVGSRILPTTMNERLAHRIREDAFEYGSTTRRPRGIAHVDLPQLRYFMRVGHLNACVLTHMDISYADTPIKVCVGYTYKGKPVEYRPDQEYLLKVKPIYKELKPWSMEAIQKAKKFDEIPSAAKAYIKFLSKELNTKIIMLTTGPRRDQSLMVPSRLA